MKTPLGVTWLYFTLFPIQKWLGYIVLAILLIFGSVTVFSFVGAGIGRIVAPPRPLLPLLFSVPVLFLLPGCMVSGAALRYFSAPKSHRLLPGFRRRMLISILALALIAAAGGSLIIVGASLLRSRLAGPAGFSAWPYATVLGLISVCVYASFRVTRASRMLVAEMIVVISLIFLASRTELADLDPALGFLAILAIVAGWASFSIWFLRAPVIAPVDLSGGNLARAGAADTDLIGRHGTEMLLTGRRPMRVSGLIATSIAVGVFTSLVFRVFIGPGIWTDESGLLIEGVAAMSFGFVLMMSASFFAARGRYLWLLGCGSRAEIFRRVECLIWLSLGMPLLLILTLLLSVDFFVTPLPARRLIAAPMFVLAYTPLVVYLGLVRLRNLGWVEMLLVVLAAGISMGIYSGVVRSGISPTAMMAVLGMLFAAAVGARFWARYRWQHVDWQEFRAARPGKPMTAMFAGHDRRK